MPRPSPLNWVPDASMSIDQAVERANALLAAATSPQPDGRVRPTLDGRTMRYYQTLGIVPPPRRAGGRRAVYRSTHLVRAVMTKLLQAGGARLGDVARSLANRSDQELWQQVGDLLQSGSMGTTDGSSDFPASVRSGIQGHTPAHLQETPPAAARIAGAGAGAGASAGTGPTQPRAITILPGVHLLMEATATADPDELLDAMRAFLARHGRS